MNCDNAAEGWWCSREAGHEGPCAARRFTWRQRLSIALDPWTYPVARWWRDWPMRIAHWLPRSVALHAFIRVYAADGQAPTREFSEKYTAWERGSQACLYRAGPYRCALRRGHSCPHVMDLPR